GRRPPRIRGSSARMGRGDGGRGRAGRGWLGWGADGGTARDVRGGEAGAVGGDAEEEWVVRGNASDNR
ncbi:MAG: hypothetical protein ACK42D_05060, partial [Candidatus Paceibacteria bacterium]